jgi:predicted negative regulator of RcsB-dependent stress response
MFTISISKLLMTALVGVIAWRGWRIYQQMQARLAAASERTARPRQSAAAKATDLVECVRCGMFVPNGTMCRSVEECSFRRK